MFWDFLASRREICAGGMKLRFFELLELSLLGDFLLVATNPKRASIRSSSTLKIYTQKNLRIQRTGYIY
jgi:hypothetical protein